MIPLRELPFSARNRHAECINSTCGRSVFVIPTMTMNELEPEAWNRWFRSGAIREIEFFHGLVACSTSTSLTRVLAVLRGEGELDRFVAMLRQLVELEKLLGGQKVTSVARYELADACRLFEQMETRAA